MLLSLFIALAFLAVAFGEAPSSTKVSASIKDTSVNGLEGFNVNVAAPFKFQDYVVGFRYALGDLRKAPESLFARRSFDTGAEGVATVDADYRLDDKTVNIAASWKSNKHGLTVSAEGDSKDRVKNVGVSKNLSWNSNKVTLNAVYDVLKKVVSGSASVAADSTTVDLEYDTSDKAPVLTVTRSIDDRNEISPSIDLKSGDISYSYKRKWDGGSLKGKLFPGEKLELEWKDEGSHGTWTTSAEVPVGNTANSKVSVAHEWKY